MNKKHILMVDDDPEMRRMFGSMLANNGFEVLYAKDGNEGREVARRMHPDMILLDYNMPIMDGIETASRLKSEKETKDIPIILLTNMDFSIEAQKDIKELGVSDYLHKGEDLNKILDRIKMVLNSNK